MLTRRSLKPVREIQNSSAIAILRRRVNRSVESAIFDRASMDGNEAAIQFPPEVGRQVAALGERRQETDSSSSALDESSAAASGLSIGKRSRLSNIGQGVAMGQSVHGLIDPRAKFDIRQSEFKKRIMGARCSESRTWSGLVEPIRVGFSRTGTNPGFSLDDL
ncbi:MAG: hypothetical protein OXN84_12050 [Albidovulum sp.]|nr:hypothetical protein [Albidovulum sp.]